MLPSFGNPGNPTDPLDLSDDGITALEAPLAPLAGQINKSMRVCNRRNTLFEFLMLLLTYLKMVSLHFGCHKNRMRDALNTNKFLTKGI